MRAILVTVLLTGAALVSGAVLVNATLLTASASAQDVEARVGALRERMERIHDDRGHHAAEDALAHATRAIRAARRAD